VTTAALWGEPLAQELARDLGGTRVVPLTAIEPDLDPACHHTNMPYVIISDRHTIAMVEGQKVAIDGPQRTNNLNRYVTTPADVAANRAEIAQVAAAWGIGAPAEHGGLIDTALSIMRYLKQAGRWTVYLAGHARGMEGHINARTGDVRLPAGMHLMTVEGGIELTCGDSKRVIGSLSDLADFAAREGTLLDAQVLWCSTFKATLARIEPVAHALLDVVRRKGFERTWSVWIPEDHFGLDAQPIAQLSASDAQRIAGYVEIAGDAFQITIGEYRQTVRDAAAVGARCEEILDAIRAWLRTTAAEPPVRDLDYYR
jgi:hypothetical protein